MQRFVIALLGALVFWAAPVLTRAASPEVIEGAKKEGEVVWYGGGSGEIDEVHAKNFSNGLAVSVNTKFAVPFLNRASFGNRAEVRVAIGPNSSSVCGQLYNKAAG
jgi:hypothetical protein